MLIHYISTQLFQVQLLRVLPRGNLNYRDQWPGIGRTYVTTAVSYDQYVDKIGGGLELCLLMIGVAMEICKSIQHH